MVEALQAPGDPLRSFGALRCTLQHPNDPSHIGGGGQLSIRRGLVLEQHLTVICGLAQRQFPRYKSKHHGLTQR